MHMPQTNLGTREGEAVSLREIDRSRMVHGVKPERQDCWIALRDGRGAAVVAAASEEEARAILAEYGVEVDRLVPAGETRLRRGVRVSLAPR
jgi:hypothetical protein